MTPQPLSQLLQDRFTKGVAFHASTTHSGARYGRFAARIHGIPHVIDLDLVEGTAHFLSFEELATIPDERPVDKLGRSKARAVLENDLARERIEDHCIDCEFFGWHGQHGPSCDKHQGAGCQCNEYKDPKWKCPIGKFGPKT